MYISEDEFRTHLHLMQRVPVLAVDTEGTLTHPFSKTWGASTSTQGVAEYFAFNHKLGNNLPAEWLPKLSQVLNNHPCLVFHHAKHDIKALRNIGVDVKNKFYCTMLMTHMIDENLPSKSLDYVSKHYGGEPKRNDDVMQKIIDAFGWDMIPVDFIRPYGANDAFITEELFERIYPNFKEQGFDGELWDWEQKFCRLLIKMEDNGVLIDQNLASRELEKGLKIMAELENELGFKPSSPTQLGNFLLEELKLPVVKRSKKTNKPSFDKAAMEVYDELLSRRDDFRTKMILTYRGWLKSTSSNYRPYLELLGPDGRLRANFKQHGTHTGRLSCEKPNLQQIPKISDQPWNGHLKDAFIVEEGRTGWEFDYSQLEMRLGAAYGKETKLIEIFADDNRDLFSEMAKELGMSRDDTKTLNYSLQYGAGIDRIRNVFGVSELAAKAIRDNYYARFRGLAVVTQLAAKRCTENGFVQYWSGRRRHFNNPSWEAHKAFNSVIQGGGFEVVKRAMVRLDEAGLNNDECKMDLQVHDSVRFDIENGKENEYIPEIKKIMEDVQPDFGVRFKVDAKKWGSAA